MKTELKFLGVVILILLAQVTLFNLTGDVVEFIHGPQTVEVGSSGMHPVSGSGEGRESMGYHQVTGPSSRH